MKFKQLEKRDLKNVNGGLTYWFYGTIPFTVAKWISDLYEGTIEKYSQPK